MSKITKNSSRKEKMMFALDSTYDQLIAQYNNGVLTIIEYQAYKELKEALLEKRKQEEMKRIVEEVGINI